jgi:hypothetical protein
VAPLERADTGNTPPVVKLSPTGPELTGPPRGIAQTMTATVGEPLTLTLWASDKGNTISQQNQFGPPPAPATSADSAAAGRGGGGRGGRGGGGGRGGARGAAPADANAAPGAGAAAAAGGADQAPAGRAGAAAAGRGGAAGRGAAAGRGGGRGGGNAPVRVRWVKHRGPGDVKVADASPAVTPDPSVTFSKPGDFSGKSTTTATFSAPGEYWLRAQVNDSTGDGGGGDQCCWTNLLVKVNVRAAGTAAR